ncbi:MAG: glutamate--cysteine ligase [Rhizobiaceae bacterium]|nr:glutamate--cysteine ligase [Rhizobiaceae bacterium]
MARDTTNNRPIENYRQLVEEIEVGCKPREKWRIGTEHEKFGFYLKCNSPVPYEGSKGIKELLNRLQQISSWDAILDDGNIIGLAAPGGGGAISLEPGGQFELSGAPLKTVHETCRESNAHLAMLKEISIDLGIGFLGVGGSPLWTFEETPRMPKSRYDIMRNYMPKVGTQGREMMYRTACIQVNLDFETESDMRRKLQVSLKLQSMASAFFASSPFTEGKPNGLLSWRSEIWKDVDNQRGGFHPFMLDKSFGFEQYVDWAMDIPMYFVIRDGKYHDCTHITFRQFMDGALKGEIADPVANMGDWTNHLATLFPDVRLKQFLEMRGADGGPWRRICALSAFWVGLLYDDNSLDAAEQYTKDWTPQMVEKLRDDVPALAFKAQIAGRPLLDHADHILELSIAGLKSRGYKNALGVDETIFLEPLRETIASGLTHAEKMLQLYHGSWQGDVNKIFQEYAY